MAVHPVTLMLAVHFLWIGIAAAGSEHPLISIKFLLAKSWYLAAFIWFPLLTLQNRKHFSLSFIALYISLLGVTLVVLARHFQMDFLFARINEAVTPFFRNHVNYSAMIVCLLPVGIAFFRLSKHKGMQRVWILASLFVLLTALFFAFSRGAWLALIIGLFAYLLLQYRILWQSYIIAICISVGMFFWLKHEDRYLEFAHDYQTTVFHTDFREHITATYNLKDISTAERFYRWVAAIRMSADYPVTGVGPGSFYFTYKPYAVPLFKTWVSDNPERSTVHNYYLLVLVEQGITGVVIFMLLTALFFYYVQRLFTRVQDVFYREVLRAVAVIMSMILVLNLLSDLVETDKIGSLFFTCFALLLLIEKKTVTDNAA